MKQKIYFNSLEKACKSVIGAIAQGTKLQFNVFYLKKEQKDELIGALPEKEDCTFPKEDAYIHVNKDGEEAKSYPMTKTESGGR